MSNNGDISAKIMNRTRCIVFRIAQPIEEMSQRVGDDVLRVFNACAYNSCHERLRERFPAVEPLEPQADLQLEISSLLAPKVTIPQSR